ncbi:MAG: cyclic nucleotide-binding domain-containing protein, partial [Pseudomonadota bacterium]
IEAPEINKTVMPYLTHSSEIVRLAALNACQVSDDKAMRAVIPLLGDAAPEVQSLSKEKLRESPFQNPVLLIESIVLPDRKVREGLFSLLESLEIKDVDIFRFARSQVERAYTNLMEAESSGIFKESPERDLLKEHLIQRNKERVETVLRVLATQDRTGQMRVIWRGVSSSDARQKSNALEALEDSLGRSLSRLLVPLLEDTSIDQCLETGKKFFQLPSFDSDPAIFYAHLLSKHDWVTVVLTLNLINKEGGNGVEKGLIEEAAKSENNHIRRMARHVLDRKGSDSFEKETKMETEISIPDKILHLRSIQIFEGLSVGEMAAIASVTEEVVYPEGEDVIKEGEQGETMFMIISGLVSVVKSQEGGGEIELDTIKAGDYFGEMALFEDQVRSATIRSKEETRVLVLHKREFNEIVREYPQIALHICKVLSQRLRKTHERVQILEKS